MQKNYLGIIKFSLIILFFTIFTDKSNAQCADSLTISSNNFICIGNSATLTATVHGSFDPNAVIYTWSPGGQNTASITVSPNTTTTYICTVSINTCSDLTKNKMIFVNQLPTVDAGLNQTICSSETINLNGTFGGSADTAYWSSSGDGLFGNITVSNGNVTATYNPGQADINLGTVSLTLTTDDPLGPLGCSAVSNVITIAINPLPSVNAGTGQTVCAGTSVTLSGLGANTYSWSNGISNNVSFTPITTTTYTVTGTITSTGCTNTDQVTVTVNALPSVNAGADQSVCVGTSVALSASGANTYSWNNGISNNVSFVPTSTATYTVTGTNTSTGCTNTDQVIVTVNPLPSVNAGSDQTVCAGTSVTLSGSGANSYLWSNGISNNISFVPTSTGTYTLTGTNTSTGCTNTDQVIVNVNPLPLVNAGADQTVCAGTSVTLSGSGANTYLWSNGISNNVSFVPTSTTTYTLTGTNTSTGCTNTDQVLITVNPLPLVNAGVDQIVCSGTAVILNASGASTYSWTGGVIDGQGFVPVSTQTYTVTGTNTTTNCTNTDQVLVTVNSSPTSNAGNDQVACIGSPVLLNGEIGGEATTAIWEGGNGIFNPNNSDLNASYLPSSDEVEAGFVVLTLTTNDPDGPCSEAENQMTITISPDLGNTSGPISDICQNSSWNLYENDCEDCFIAWEVVGGEIQGYASSNAVYVQWDNIIPNSYLVLAITNPSTGCSANDTLFPTFSTNSAPVTQEVLMIDADFNLLGLNQTNYGIYTWGYSLKNQYTAFDIVSSGNPYASYPTIDTLNYDYWVEYGDVNQCLTRSYYNKPGILGVNALTENSVFAYPNPFTDNITLGNITEESEVRLYNSVGTLVVNTSISPSNNQIQTSYLQDGMYFVYIEQKNKSALIFKLIKK